MYTHIKQRELNTPLLQRINEQMDSQKRTKAESPILCLNNVNTENKISLETYTSGNQGECSGANIDKIDCSSCSQDNQNVPTLSDLADNSNVEERSQILLKEKTDYDHNVLNPELEVNNLNDSGKENNSISNGTVKTDNILSSNGENTCGANVKDEGVQDVLIKNSGLNRGNCDLSQKTVEIQSSPSSENLTENETLNIKLNNRNLESDSDVIKHGTTTSGYLPTIVNENVSIQIATEADTKTNNFGHVMQRKNVCTIKTSKKTSVQKKGLYGIKVSKHSQDVNNRPCNNIFSISKPQTSTGNRLNIAEANINTKPKNFVTANASNFQKSNIFKVNAVKTKTSIKTSNISTASKQPTGKNIPKGRVSIDMKKTWKPNVCKKTGLERTSQNKTFVTNKGKNKEQVGSKPIVSVIKQSGNGSRSKIGTSSAELSVVESSNKRRKLDEDNCYQEASESTAKSGTDTVIEPVSEMHGSISLNTKAFEENLPEKNMEKAEAVPGFSVSQAMIDEFHIMFEDESPQEAEQTEEPTKIKEKNCRRKSRRSMDFTPNRPILLEARSSTSDTPTEFAAPVDNVNSREAHNSPVKSLLKESHDADELPDLNDIAKGKPKRRGCKRRSADFDIINNREQVSLSPDIQLEGLAEMQTLPGTRKSRRIRRQSIEMCQKRIRQNALYINIDDIDSSDPGDPESPIPDSPNLIGDKECDVNNSLGQSPLVYDSTRRDCSIEEHSNENSLNCSDISKDIGSDDNFLSNSTIEVNLVKCVSDSITDNVNNNSTNIEQSDTTVLDSGSKTRGRKPRSKKSTKSTDVETEQKSSVRETRKTVNTKGRKRKRQVEEPAIEDIYRNKLWRTQMPMPEKPWETIYEDPLKNKSGNLQYISVKRSKRILNYEEFYTQQKLKRRRQKANKMGYKPLTKKKNEVAEQLVAEKLALLDDQILLEVKEEERCLAVKNENQNNSSDNTELNNRQVLDVVEEKFYTPMTTPRKSLHSFARTIDTHSLNEASEDLKLGSDSHDYFTEEIFQTPQQCTPPKEINMQRVIEEGFNKMTVISEDDEQV